MYEKKYLDYLAKGGEPISYLHYNNDNQLEIDIANCRYENLSADWQQENKDAATVVEKILEAERRGKKYSLDEIGHIIHEAWRKRNSWCKGGELDTLFVNLNFEEQDKDVRQYLIAKEVESEYIKKHEDNKIF